VETFATVVQLSMRRNIIFFHSIDWLRRPLYNVFSVHVPPENRSIQSNVAVPSTTGTHII
jgi:hypothetical protein